MIPETKKAKQELAGFLSEAIDIDSKKAELNRHLKEIKDEAKKRWDITPKEFSTFVKAASNRAKVSSDADVLNEALEFVGSLEK